MLVRYIYRIILILTITLFASSCKKENYVSKANDEAGFTLNISTPNITIETKGLDNPQTQWEKSIDGGFIYNFTLFLIDNTNFDHPLLVGYRDFEWDNSDTKYNEGNGINKEGTKVKVRFDYTFPLHKDELGQSTEKLQRGHYRLIMLANYKPARFDEFGNCITVNGIDIIPSATAIHTFNGLNGIGSDGYTQIYLPDLMIGLINYFDAHISEGLAFNPLADSHAMDFYRFQIKAGADGLCPLEPQVLSSSSNIELGTGENALSASLERSRARIRISVENNSSSDILKLKGLSFPRFAQPTAMLMENPDRPNFIYQYYSAADGKYYSPVEGVIGAEYNVSKYISGLKDLDVSSSHAIVPFTGSATNPLSIPSHTRQVVFDAYILGSNRGDHLYPYTPYLDYEKPDYARDFRILAGTAPVAVSQDATFTEGYYIIQNAFNRCELICGGTTLLPTVEDMLDANGPTADKYYSAQLGNINRVWHFIPVNSTDNGVDYYIRAKSSDRYISTSNSQNASVAMNINQNSSIYYEVIPTQNSGIWYWALKGYTKWFLDAYNTSKISVWSSVATSGQTGGAWKLFPLTANFGALYRDITPLEIINPQTSHREEVTHINRNDFFNILITASFEENIGNLNFQVLPWNTIENTIEFE